MIRTTNNRQKPNIEELKNLKQERINKLNESSIYNDDQSTTRAKDEVLLFNYLKFKEQKEILFVFNSFVKC